MPDWPKLETCTYSIRSDRFQCVPLSFRAHVVLVSTDAGACTVPSIAGMTGET